MPATISFIRISMGCVKMERMPGMPSSTVLICCINSSWVLARLHRSRGVSVRNTSETSSPMGSVATSAVPVRVQTWAVSSGNSASSSCSICVP